MNLLKKIKAKLNKTPFFIKQYWQPAWIDFNSEKKLFEGFSPVIFDNNSKVGNEVKLLTNGSVNHFYKVKKINKAGGSDHIVTALSFDFEYTRTCAI